MEALGPHVDMLYKGRAYFISQNNELILINHNRVFFFLNCILICLTCSISFHVQALNVKFKQWSSVIAYVVSLFNFQGVINNFMIFLDWLQLNPGCLHVKALRQQMIFFDETYSINPTMEQDGQGL